MNWPWLGKAIPQQATIFEDYASALQLNLCNRTLPNKVYECVARNTSHGLAMIGAWTILALVVFTLVVRLMSAIVSKAWTIVRRGLLAQLTAACLPKCKVYETLAFHHQSMDFAQLSSFLVLRRSQYLNSLESIGIQWNSLKLFRIRQNPTDLRNSRHFERSIPRKLT